MKIKLDIKPLSVNEAFQGKRYKTNKYNTYESKVLALLPDIEIKRFERLKLVFGVSSRLADLDNPTKLIIDIIQKKYKVNDRELIYLELHKVITKKGFEFVEIEFI
jgi:hypothetical protein